MRRRAMGCTVFGVSVLWALVSVTPCPAAERQSELTLRRAVLLSCGVGFFEHDAQVEGDQAIELAFNVHEINDLLKSLVVRDLSGGIVSSVTYESRDPVSKTLRALKLDLAGEPTIGELMSQLRGHRVRVEASRTLEGTIIGVETRPQAAKDQVIGVEWLNMHTKEGLQSVSLDGVQSIKVLDTELDRELQEALNIIAGSRDSDQKVVAIHFKGKGKRKVQIGYIREAPVWKISYRLVVEDKKPPLLQGWAIVENTSDRDWKNVQLTLVSGQPVSFIMELYEPLYMERPTVMPQLYGAVAPCVHDRATRRPAPAAFGGMGGMGGMRGGMGGMRGGMGGGGFGGRFGGAPTRPAQPKGKRLEGTSSLSPEVAGQEVGELFRYDIQLPVTIACNQSAMLPIVNQNVKCEKLSIYNQDEHVRHPMNGLKLMNSTDLHLMQGPITVFDGGMYAGDAQIGDLAPKASRLMTYALDLDVDVRVTHKKPSKELATVQIRSGQLATTYEQVLTTCYVVDNTSVRSRKLLIEHPINKPWRLRPNEALRQQTTKLYRLFLLAEPDKTAGLDVVEEQATEEFVKLEKLDDFQLQLYLADKKVPERVKNVLRELLTKRRELANILRESAAAEKRVQTITMGQSRVRENMKVLERTNELYKTCAQELASQEKELTQLNDKIDQLRKKQTELQEALDQFMIEAKA